MGKNKRPRKLTVFGCVEGHREQAFIDLLREIYQPELHNIAFYPENANGGGADNIVIAALRKSDRDRSFAWLDEDFEPKASPLSKEVRKQLAKSWSVSVDDTKALLECPLGKLQSTFNLDHRKPTLIISQPVCCDSLILQILGHDLPYGAYYPARRNQQINDLKNKLDQLMQHPKSTEEQTAYYRKVLNKNILEQKRKKIAELNLLISMLTK